MEYDSINVKINLKNNKVAITGVTKETEMEESKVVKQLYPLFDKPTASKDENERKLKEIWNLINNAKYLSDIRPRSFYNLIHEIAEVIEPDYDGDELGKDYLD